jgi:hypothetical protein
MRRFAILASVVVLAAASANCSSSSEKSVLGPSSLSDSAAVSASGKGGGKPGGGGSTGGSGSLTLVMSTDNNGDGRPNWGDTVTFNVSTTATTTPNVDLKCSKNGVVVYGATTGFYASYPWPWTNFMTLSSASWQSGSADCTATLYYFSGSRNTILSTLSFTAGA